MIEASKAFFFAKKKQKTFVLFTGIGFRAGFAIRVTALEWRS